ncbi:MAG TPA: hypothetical protein PLB10_09530 [Thiolinea sp.]|nr:hypothetical protein [Thiolinea sp.]
MFIRAVRAAGFRTGAVLGLFLLSTPLFAISPFIGINTNEPVWFDASVPFVDLFKTSEPFRDNRELTRGNVQYDADGWVTRLNGGQAGGYFVRWLPTGALPQGNYTVRYDGSGKLAYTESATLVSSQPGRDVITLRPNADNEISAALIIQQSDPANPLRNIRITLPGGICQGNPFQRVNSAAQCGGKPFLDFENYAEQVRFNPDYLNFMRQFRTLRFMGMSGITRNERQVSWTRRANLQEATWSGGYGERGIPVEVMVDLANRLNANAWFNIPHLADQDYIQQFARYVARNLRPNLKAYIEYSNEMWNTAFSQAQYAQREGYRDQLDADPLLAGLKFYSFRSLQVFRTWDQAFQGNRQRLVRVLSGWAGNPATTAPILTGSNVYRETDAFAIAPYFYASQEALMQVRSVDDVFRLINDPQQHYSVDNTLNIVNKHAEILKPYKIPLVAYEGGQHLVHYGTQSKRQHPNPILAAANRDPRMEQAYIRLLQGFRQAGGTLFMAFSSPRINGHYGFWGIKEYLNEPPAQTPKYRALTRF